jgi:hypothetical protein
MNAMLSAVDVDSGSDHAEPRRFELAKRTSRVVNALGFRFARRTIVPPRFLLIASTPVLAPARDPPFFASRVLRRKLGELDTAPSAQAEMFGA